MNINRQRISLQMLAESVRLIFVQPSPINSHADEARVRIAKGSGNILFGLLRVEFLG